MATENVNQTADRLRKQLFATAQEITNLAFSLQCRGVCTDDEMRDDAVEFSWAASAVAAAFEKFRDTAICRERQQCDNHEKWNIPLPPPR